MDTNGDTRMLLLKDLCSRLPYGVNVKTTGDNEAYTLLSVNTNKNIALIGLNFGDVYATSNIKIDEVKPYLRPMSSMTEEEKKELLCTIVGKDAVKYFQVLSDGSIDNTDSAHQDLQNFTMHWINFDGINTSSYIDWLNARHFDYRGLIPRGLAIEVTESNNPYKE